MSQSVTCIVDSAKGIARMSAPLVLGNTYELSFDGLAVDGARVVVLGLPQIAGEWPQADNPVPHIAVTSDETGTLAMTTKELAEAFRWARTLPPHPNLPADPRRPAPLPGILLHGPAHPHGALSLHFYVIGGGETLAQGDMTVFWAPFEYDEDGTPIIFQGPPGPKGDTGPQGPQGERGADAVIATSTGCVTLRVDQDQHSPTYGHLFAYADNDLELYHDGDHAKPHFWLGTGTNGGSAGHLYYTYYPADSATAPTVADLGSVIGPRDRTAEDFIAALKANMEASQVTTPAHNVDTGLALANAIWTAILQTASRYAALVLACLLPVLAVLLAGAAHAEVVAETLGAMAPTNTLYTAGQVDELVLHGFLPLTGGTLTGDLFITNRASLTVGSRKVNSAGGANSLANGYHITAAGDYGHAEGYETKAQARAAHAEGIYSTAAGDYGHAEGDNTYEEGRAGHAEGYQSKVYGAYSHAEGYETVVSNAAHAHAEGFRTRVLGSGSHTDGKYADATNETAYVWSGQATETNRYASHGDGTYNIDPEGGLAGFYVGETSLAETFSGYATTGEVATVAAELDARVDTNAAAIATNAAAIAELEAVVATHPTNSFLLSAAMEPQEVAMDIFEVTMTPRLSDVGTTNETIAAEKSILAQKVETTDWAGYLLAADIQASKSETNTVSYQALYNGTTYTNSAGEAFFRVDGANSFGNLYALFGEASRLYLNIPRLTNDTVQTNYLYVADTPGSLRAGVNAMTNAVNAAGERGWTVGTENFALGSNWTFGCIGKGDSPGHPFQATLITPRHAIVAGHCAPPIGTQFRWDAASIGHRTAKVEKRRSLTGDRCVVYLDDYVDAPAALLLDGPSAASANLTLPESVSGIPGLYVAAFHQGTSVAVSRVTADLGLDATLQFLPATNALPTEIADIDYIGGDSSSPVFLLPPDSSRPVLVSCAWHTLGRGHGGNGPNWASQESWDFLMRAMNEMDVEMGYASPRPERYDLTSWPVYNTPPTPETE